MTCKYIETANAITTNNTMTAVSHKPIARQIHPVTIENAISNPQ
jgi:hypothetical protein